MIDIVVSNGNKDFERVGKELGINLLDFSDKNISKQIKLKQNPTRKDFESKDFDILFDLENNSSNDKITTLSSGMNHILAKIAKEKNKIIGFTLQEVISAKNKPKIIARIRQNIKLINKYDLDVCIFSFAQEPYQMCSLDDLRCFFINLGLHEKKAKDALLSIEKRLVYNEKKKKGDLVIDGIERIL